jgi:hypothetical protein
MKTFELINQQDWFIIFDDERERIKYVFKDEIYSKLESIIVEADFALDYPLMDGPHLNAPNMKLLGFRGRGCKMCIQSLNRNGFSAPIIDTIEFERIGINQIPEFIYNFKTIKDLHFRQEKLREMPSGLFDLINLQTLRFQYGSQIPVIADAIQNLVNLEYFDFWESKIHYRSPELFRLPRKKYINFSYSSFNPSKEVEEAVEEFKMKNSNNFHGWQNYQTHKKNMTG